MQPERQILVVVNTHHKACAVCSLGRWDFECYWFHDNVGCPDPSKLGGAEKQIVEEYFDSVVYGSGR